MELQLKKEYLEKLKRELSDNDYDLYLRSLEQGESHGLTVNLHKLKKSSIDLNYIIDRFSGKQIFKNENYAYIVYDKNALSSYSIYPGKDPLYHAGLYYIQEPSASKTLYDVDFKNDDIVLDLCASPGGKAAAILFSLNKESGGFLVSNEIDYGRAKILSSNIERLGFRNVAITCCESKILADKFYNYFDKVIVDAPCSGEGMFRKSEEARLQWTENLVLSLSKLQKKLVDDAYQMIRDGGVLIYSTCTFSKEEDEEIVDFLLNKYSDLRLQKMEKNYPFNSIGEGQFFAIMSKGEVSDRNVKREFDIRCLNGLNVMRAGIEEFTNEKNLKVPTHASTHVDDIDFENVVELSDEDVSRYLRGEAIRIELPFKGYCKICYKNLGLGLAKYSNGMLKNHYPKGLRNN